MIEDINDPIWKLRETVDQTIDRVRRDIANISKDIVKIGFEQVREVISTEGSAASLGRDAILVWESIAIQEGEVELAEQLRNSLK